MSGDLGRQGRLRVPRFCTIDMSIKRLLYFESGRLDLLYTILLFIVCPIEVFVLFLVIEVTIYVIGICGYTQRSLIKSHFS